MHKDDFDKDTEWLADELKNSTHDSNAVIRTGGIRGFIKHVKDNTNVNDESIIKKIFKRWWNLSYRERERMHSFRWKVIVDDILHRRPYNRTK